jgi:hypothetical protein
VTASQAERLKLIRWQIENLFTGRGLHEWTTLEGAQYKALTAEERVLLDAR